MTVEWWTGAERFYELWVFVWGLLFLLALIGLVFVFTYAKKDNRKKPMRILMGLLALVGLLSLNGHRKYHFYLEQARYSNPLIRDREPKLNTYQYYGETEELIYSQLNGIDSLRKMVLYEEEPVTVPLIYLGQDENFHYFEHPEGHLFKQTLKITFSETAAQTQLKGSRFTLKDEAFREIGFKNPEPIMYEAIEIPVAEQEKRFGAEEKEAFIPRIEDTLPDWNF